MKINSKQISAKLHELPIEEVSHLTSFVIRKGGKINGFDFLMGFFLMILNGFNTVEKWAAQVSKLSGGLISTQSLQEKLQFRHQKFAEALLGYVLRHQIQRTEITHIPASIFTHFNRVFLEDSTCVKLPASLAAFFPGNYNHKGDGATARIQLRIELFSGEYTYLELQSYRDNDQKFAYHIIGQLLRGDLVIRDLGYGVLGAFRMIMGLNAFFLSRLRFGINIYDSESGQQIDLLKKLRSLRRKGGTVLDIEVLLG